jgi:hypothetical protein
MDAWVIPAGVLLVLILVAPGRIGERLIGSVFQLVLWIVKLPFRAGQTFFRTVLVWMGMEVRRWVGILVGGVLVLIVAQTIIRETQPGSPWRLVALLMCLIWLVALFGAGRMTLEYLSLRRVRQNRQFVELAEGVRNIQGQVRSLQGQLVGTAAQQPWRTPVEGVFSANRSARAEERAAGQHAAEQPERERVPDAPMPDHDPFQ